MVLVVHRPQPGVIARQHRLRLGVALLEQGEGAGVARDLREVVETDQRLQVRVDHTHVRVEAVDRVERAVRHVHANAIRWRLLEGAERVRAHDRERGVA